MIEQHLRPIAQRYVFSPCANMLAPHLSANEVTLISCILGVLVIPAYYMVGAWLATTLLLLSGMADILDGTIARMRQDTSPAGGIYDILADRTVEAAVIIALYITIPQTGLLCLLMLTSVLLCVSSFLLAGIYTAPSGEKSFYYSSGLMERAEAFLFFIAMMWFPEHFVILSILFIILVLYTATIRIKELTSQLLR